MAKSNSNKDVQAATGSYSPDGEELEVKKLVQQRLKESKDNFTSYERDRFDLFYKNYRSYSGDRLQKLKKAGGADWMSNMFVPMTASHIRALHPRILSAQPELRVNGRTEEDSKKGMFAQGILEYLWEKSNMDVKMRDFVWQALVYGTSVGKIRWKKEMQLKSDEVLDEETLETKDVEDLEEVYNDPDFEVVDLYNFYPDPLATSLDDARYVIQRYLMTKEQILETYGDLIEENVEFISKAGGGDTQDYANVRYEVSDQDNLEDNSLTGNSSSTGVSRPEHQKSLHEVIEYWEKNRFVLYVDGVVLRMGKNPFGIPEFPFVLVRYETLPFEFYGIGVAEQLEQPQKTLNIIRNQRIDNVTLSIQKMFIANPYALISQKDLVARPFGVIRTTDPNGVSPVDTPEVKSSAFEEDALTQEAGRLATGIDDRSRGIQGPASSTATDITTQKESTIERVKIFVGTLETDCYEKIMRYWLAMASKLYPTERLTRITDALPPEEQDESLFEESDNVIRRPIMIKRGKERVFTFATKDDLWGNFDIKALSLSTLAATKELKIQRLLDLMDKAVVAGINPVTQRMVPNLEKLWEQLFLAYDMDPDEMINAPQDGVLPNPEGSAITEAGAGAGAATNAQGEPTAATPSADELINNIEQQIAGIGALGTQASSERTTPLPPESSLIQASLQTNR